LGDLSPDPLPNRRSIPFRVTLPELPVDSRVDQPIMGGLVVLTRGTSSIPESILHARGINFFEMARVGKAKVQLTYDRDENYNRSNEMLYKDYVL